MDKYTWRDIGSSFLPGELTAAFLWGQLEQAVPITRRRLALWKRYQCCLRDFALKNGISVPRIPKHCRHNAHLFYLILPTRSKRDEFILKMKNKKIGCVFHYIPLHLSPFGRKKCRVSGKLVCTETISERLVRLPLWIGMEKLQIKIIAETKKALQFKKNFK